jgi:hypothetical protein
VRWIVRLAALALLALVVTRLHERQVDLSATADDLGVERNGIVQAEGYVGDLDARIDDAADRMHDLDRQVTALETRHPNGIPAAVRDDYDRLLTQRNEAAAEHNHLVSRRRTAMAEYDQRVATHNDHVEDANALAEESTPWRVVRGLWERVVGPPADE